MGTKAILRRHLVLVDDAKWAVLGVALVVVIGKRKAVVGFEPSVVGVATLSRGTGDDLHVGGLVQVNATANNKNEKRAQKLEKVAFCKEVVHPLHPEAYNDDQE